MRLRYIALVQALLMTAASSSAMVGGPIFCVGDRATCMTVEVERAAYHVPMSDLPSGRGGMDSRRVFLTGRYGLQDFLDGFLRFGAAEMSFDEFDNGYSPFESSPSLAWGAGLRAGFAITEKLELNANVSYLGFRASGDVTRNDRKISNTYLWQELAPSLTLGYRVSEVTPYIGVGKTYITGRRDFDVSYQGSALEMASGSESFSDGEQPISPLAGIEWHLPDGYSLTAEAAAGSDGDLGMSIGLSQALR